MTGEDRQELRQMLEDVLKPIVKQQEEHHTTLFGNGSEQNQGLRVDVDRLKQIEGGRSRHFWAVYLALLGLVLKDLWTWVRSLGGAPHVNP